MRTALLLLLAQAGAGDVALTTGGALMMIGCCGLVLGLNTFCLVRILRPSTSADRHHAPQEIDTRDAEG